MRDTDRRLVKPSTSKYRLEESTLDRKLPLIFLTLGMGLMPTTKNVWPDSYTVLSKKVSLIIRPTSEELYLFYCGVTLKRYISTVLTRVENYAITLVPHFFSQRGHVRLIVGNNWYEWKDWRLTSDEFGDFLEERHTIPYCFDLDEKTYWLFEDRLYKDNEGLTADEVKALLITRNPSRQKNRLPIDISLLRTTRWNDWPADILYIWTNEENLPELRRLVEERWQADEIRVLVPEDEEMRMANLSDEDNRVLYVWWED